MQCDIRRRYGSIPTCRDFVPNYGTQHPSARLYYFIPRILSQTKDTNGFYLYSVRPEPVEGSNERTRHTC
jgi:hypothetical protein